MILMRKGVRGEGKEQKPDSAAAHRLDAVIVKGSWRVYFFGKGCTGDKALGN